MPNKQGRKDLHPVCYAVTLDNKWDEISMDFMASLPRTARQH